MGAFSLIVVINLLNSWQMTSSDRQSHKRSRSRRRSRSSSRKRERARPKCEYDSISDGYRLYVSEYTSSTSSDDLSALFEKYGRLRENVFISRSKHFAFAVFKYEKDALVAYDALHRKEFKGARIRVSYREPSPERSEKEKPVIDQQATSRPIRHSFGETRSCYTCGKTGHISKDCPPQRNGRNLFLSSSRSRSRSKSRSRRRSRSRDNKYYGRRR